MRRLLVFLFLSAIPLLAQSSSSGGVRVTGSPAANDCAKFVSHNVITTAGAACGAGGGGSVLLAPTTDQTITGAYALILSDAGSTFWEKAAGAFGSQAVPGGTNPNIGGVPFPGGPPNTNVTRLDVEEKYSASGDAAAVHFPIVSGLDINYPIDDTAGDLNAAILSESETDPASTHNVRQLDGHFVETDHNGSGTLSFEYGVESQVFNDAGGTVTTLRAFNAVLGNFGAGTVGTAEAIFIAAPTILGGSISHNYGIFIQDQRASSGGTNPDPWAIWIDGGKNNLGPQSTQVGGLDASAATNPFKIPVVTGATATANGQLAYDSTSNNLHVANANADSIAPVTTITPVNGNCATWTVASGKIKLGDTGSPCGGTPGGGIIGYSAASLTLTANTYFFPIVGGGTPSTTETSVDTEAPSAATIANFYASVSVALGGGNSAVFTYRNNASDQSMTCTISGASTTSCNDSTHSFAVAKGDLLTIKVVTTGTIVVTPTLVMTAQFGTTGSNGTVNTGTTGQTAYYAAGGTAVSGVGPGTTTTVLHGNAAGAPSFGSVNLASDVTGQLPIANVGSSGLSGTSPVTISAPGAIACATCVVASSPGVGIAHFAGSTQTVTSSTIVNADIANTTIDLTAKVTGVLPSANGGTVSVTATGITMPNIPSAGALVNGVSSLVAAQNEVDCMRSVAPFTITATKVGYRPVTSAGSSSHVGVAIYSADGSTRLMTTGALDGTLTGKQTPTTVSSFTLQQGVAYLTCVTNDQASPGTWSIYGFSITAAVNDAFFNTTSNTTNFVKAANASVAGAPPTTTGALTAISSTANGLPAIFIQP